MTPAEVRALQHLPTSLDAWEVALLELPATIDGVETEGLLLVAEQGTGLIRSASPQIVGEPLWTGLGSAFLSPPNPCSPARTQQLLCTDPQLLARLESELEGLDIRLRLVLETPAIDEIMAEMAEHFSPLPVPGITHDHSAWAAVLEAFVQQKPWQRVGDDVLFTFIGAAGLAGHVAVVLGEAGEQIGVVLYPSMDDYLGFLDASLQGDLDALEKVEAANLYLDPPDEFDEEDLASCREAGLVTSIGLFPRLLVLAGGRPFAANETAQQSLLAALQAITTLSEQVGEDLGRGPVTGIARTVQGIVRVDAAPYEPTFPILYDRDYALATLDLPWQDRTLPTLVLKLRKRDAERLINDLEGLDAMWLTSEGDTQTVWAVHNSTPFGILLHNDQTGLDLARVFAGPTALLCVSAGGPKRPRLLPTEFLLLREVPVSVRDL